MLKKALLATSTAAAALGFSSGALADPPDWARAHGWRQHHEHYEHYEHYRPYYVAPRPVYVAPQPVYVVPAPRVVYAARAGSGSRAGLPAGDPLRHAERVHPPEPPAVDCQLWFRAPTKSAYGTHF